FDLLTIMGLFLLGRRIRGPTLGVVLAYAWAAYPFTLWTLSSNTNDTLVAMLLVFALLAIGSPAGRGVLAALAGLTKFIPLALALLVAFVPRDRGVVDVAALAAAVVIAIELAASYWLYSYIVWFFPMVAIALFGSYPSREPESLSELRLPAPAPARSPSPALT